MLRERQEVVLVVVAPVMDDELLSAAILNFDDWHVPSILAEFEVNCLQDGRSPDEHLLDLQVNAESLMARPVLLLTCLAAVGVRMGDRSAAAAHACRWVVADLAFGYSLWSHVEQ